MLPTLKTIFRRLRRKFNPQPERSLPLRMLILAAMLVPLLALGRVHAGLWPHVILAGLAISAGHWYSYRHLDKPNKAVRGAMFIAIHLALCWMFAGLAFGATVPQAQFAIYAQAITSFDLRHRSSLFNTLINSLAILYVAASLSRTTELGLYLLAFTGLVLAAFFLAGRASGRQSSQMTAAKIQPLPHPARPMTLFGLGFGVLALLLIVVVFLFTPRFANRPIVPPFTLNLPLRGGTTSEIINPGLPLVQVNGWSNEVGDYYYGFDTNLDLRYRGGLSDAIVMYVRSPSRSYWRSHSYDFYDGISWAQSDRSLTEIPNGGAYYGLPAPLGSPQTQARFGEAQPDGNRLMGENGRARTHARRVAGQDDSTAQYGQQIVQSFTIVHQQPNLLFAAYRPLEIFMRTDQISLDTGDGIRLPEPLKAGMTYSVVSYRPEFEPARLRQLPAGPYPIDVTERYLQLPNNISARVRALAQTLAAPHNNVFDQLSALNSHLLAEYPYNYFPPPHPPGAEVVDTFLFEDKEGVCEQYVTALVVMARSLGIPARLAAGYGAGDYNPVTGYYEVRFSHAHAWAEVYFPEVGWVPFDPTPGWEPQPYPTPAQNWIFSNNGQLFNQLSGLDLPLGALFSGSMAGLALIGPLLAGLLLVGGLIALAMWLARRFNWLGGGGSGYSFVDGDPTRRLILRLYRQAATHLARRQKLAPRAQGETVAEFARRSGQLDSSGAFGQLSALAEAAAYRPQPPDKKEAEAACAASARLRKE